MFARLRSAINVRISSDDICDTSRAFRMCKVCFAILMYLHPGSPVYGIIKIMV